MLRCARIALMGGTGVHGRGRTTLNLMAPKMASPAAMSSNFICVYG